MKTIEAIRRARWQAGLPAAGIAACLPCFGGGSSSTSAETSQTSTQDNFGVSDTAQGAAGDNNTQNRDSNNTTNVDASTWEQTNVDASNRSTTWAQDNSNRSTNVDASDRSVQTTNVDASDRSVDNSNRSTNLDASDRSSKVWDSSNRSTTNVNASDNRAYDSSNRSTNNTTLNVSDLGAIRAGADLGQSAISSNFSLSGKVVDSNATLVKDLMRGAQDFVYKTQQQAQENTAAGMQSLQTLSNAALTQASAASGDASGEKMKLVGIVAAVAIAAFLLKGK